MEEKEKTSAAENPAIMNDRQLAREIAQLASDRHCEDVVILDLIDRSPIARYFVIATGTSEQQIQSVASEVVDLGKEKKYPPYNSVGLQRGRWVVVDLVDIVVHFFDSEFRSFYDLELLWGDAPKVAWSRDETD